MSELEDIERDILDFLSKVDSLKHSDRKELLTLIFKKHILTNKSDVMLSYDDFQMVVSNAKTLYTQIAFPVKLTDERGNTKDVTGNEIANFCVAESMISLLNRKEALKRLPVFKKGR